MKIEVFAMDTSRSQIMGTGLDSNYQEREGQHGYSNPSFSFIHIFFKRKWFTTMIMLNLPPLHEASINVTFYVSDAANSTDHPTYFRDL